MTLESVESFSCKNLQIASLNRNRSVSIEKASKGRMFFIVYDTKSFMESEYFVIQSSDMTDPYKWVIADVLSEKNTFSTVDPNNKL